LIIILAGLGWMTDSRLMRGVVLSLKEQSFIEASKAMGASSTRIIQTHLVPNALAPMIVSASLGLAGLIIYEAALSFLGFGIQDPTPTWGNMLASGQSYMFQHPGCHWSPVYPSFYAPWRSISSAMVCATLWIRGSSCEIILGELGEFGQVLPTQHSNPQWLKS